MGDVKINSHWADSPPVVSQARPEEERGLVNKISRYGIRANIDTHWNASFLPGLIAII